MKQEVRESSEALPDVETQCRVETLNLNVQLRKEEAALLVAHEEQLQGRAQSMELQQRTTAPGDLEALSAAFQANVQALRATHAQEVAAMTTDHQARRANREVENNRMMAHTGDGSAQGGRGAQ